jgi:hypothetical protein
VCVCGVEVGRENVNVNGTPRATRSLTLTHTHARAHQGDTLLRLLVSVERRQERGECERVRDDS